MEKKDLKKLDVIVLRNGDELVFLGDNFEDLSIDNDNYICDLDDLNDDLTSTDARQSDVVKVIRSVVSSTIWEREDKPVKMTVSEVCKKLGYDVEIVKEKEND